MSQGSSDLGGRLPLLHPDELSEAQQKAYATIDQTMVPWAQKSGFRAKNDDGTLIGPFNAVLLSPQITEAFLALQHAEAEHTTLTDAVRQVVILTVGSVWRSDYELYAHSAVARSTGLSEETISQLTSGSPAAGLTDDQRLAQRFTQRVTADRHVDDELYAEAEAVFGAQGIMDILYLAGGYDTVCSLLNTFKVPAPRD